MEGQFWMANKADFYVGEGPTGEWLGSIAWDGYRDGIPQDIREAKSEEEYREAVLSFLNKRPDAILAEVGWPWPWDNSSRTNYAYSFRECVVFGCRYGSSWWRADFEEPDPTTLRRGVARFPDMSVLSEKFVSHDGEALPLGGREKKNPNSSE